jgi:RsiW-degrading membrane proteinase PrsW (M82 family)
VTTAAATLEDTAADVSETPGPRRGKFAGLVGRSSLPHWVVVTALVLVVLAVCATFAWALHHELRDAMGPRAFRWALVYALIPVIPLSAFFIWLDRLRPEPIGWLLVALLWGAFGAAYFSLQLNSWLAHEIGDSFGATPRAAIFVAPWVEETMKAAIIFVIVIARRHDFNAVVAGVVYGGIIGVGFACTENVLYYGQAYQATLRVGGNPTQALDQVQQVFEWRGLETPFVHSMFTMMTGLGVGLAVRYKHLGVRILAPVAGFCAAVLLHMGFNGIVSFISQGNLASVYVPILLPVLLTLIGLVLVIRRHERRVMRARLHDYTAFGWLRPDHVDFIATWTGRRRARVYVRAFGKAEQRRVREFQKAGIDLGVLRDRMVRGVAGPRELPRERVLIQTMRDFRGRVMLPGISEPPLDHRAPATSSW